MPVLQSLFPKVAAADVGQQTHLPAQHVPQGTNAQHVPAWRHGAMVVVKLVNGLTDLAQVGHAGGPIHGGANHLYRGDHEADEQSHHPDDHQGFHQGECPPRGHAERLPGAFDHGPPRG